MIAQRAINMFSSHNRHTVVDIGSMSVTVWTWDK